MRSRVIVQLYGGIVQRVEVEKGGPELDVTVLENKKYCNKDKEFEIESGFYSGDCIFSHHESGVANPTDMDLVSREKQLYLDFRDADNSEGTIDQAQFKGAKS